MRAEDVVDLVGYLETRGIQVWIDGGWGVDALLEEQTRPHDDLDLITALEEMATIQQILSRRGYLLLEGGAPMTFKMTDDAGRQIDVHSVVFTESGSGIFTMHNGAEWVCPAFGFEGVGHVLARQIRCLTPEVKVQRICQSGYEIDLTHARDLTALSERFGIPVPDSVALPPGGSF
jgi:lincosamide nucleotidyltransferase A/C/D/E